MILMEKREEKKIAYWQQIKPPLSTFVPPSGRGHCDSSNNMIEYHF
jgi:hypothetical protein